MLTNIKRVFNFFLKNESYFCIAFFLIIILSLYFLGIGCPTRFLTGISCPGCGMTRAVMQILKLDFNKAFYFHPMVFSLPIIAILFIKKDKINPVILNSLLVIIIVLFMIVYVMRLLDINDEIVYADIERSFVYKFIKILSS